MVMNGSGYGASNDIVLNLKEFELFCDLYSIDLNNRKNNYNQEKDYFINDEIIQNLLNQENRLYIIRWV